MIHLGEIIQKERRHQQESQETLAKAIGVSRQTILNWEKGRTLPDSASLVQIAQRYQLSFDELIGLQVADKQRQIWKKFAILLGLFSLGMFISRDTVFWLPALIFCLLAWFLIQEFILTK